MRRSIPTVLLLLVTSVVALGCSESPAAPSASAPSTLAASATAGRGRAAVGFNGTARGFPTGEVRLTGGGSYDPASASNTLGVETTVASAGGFDCVASIAQGPLNHCAAGEGVRWDTAQLLASTHFKCTGAASEALKLAVTSENTAVLQADFYRAGDGNDESFTAQMIVSDTDLAPDIAGTQTLWVQGVGCGDANAHFN